MAEWHAIINEPDGGPFAGHEIVEGDPECPTAIIAESVWDEDHARLMAQAPALMAALEALDSFLDFGEEVKPGEWDIDDPAGINAAFRQARAAMKNAKE